MARTGKPQMSGNPYIGKLVTLLDGPQPKITSMDTYCDFIPFLDQCLQAELPDIQGWKLVDDGDHVRYFGEHYNDYEFVWKNRAVFNDFIDRVNKEYQAYLNS